MIDAFFIRKYGGPNVLKRGRVSAHDLGPHDVHLQVHAASVDWRSRDGALKVLLPYRFARVLGNDALGVVGVVMEVSPAVRRFKPRDAVYTRVRDHRLGTFALETVTHE
ncbi:hypothetical protein [Deinococcus yavapaiensis]|uniref:Uncharacterized protein n=1 Tax=Deinococcus yavapaiensis KR-236 TaxID=694435 RepID=A0A318SHF7_9DEIO|nr:hypothetical protein [Deinococcus yavapaiensis]PYE50442.1 hypothetical protein DES52_11859 [Deinococcus yavapaiensis KR-236]